MCIHIQIYVCRDSVHLDSSVSLIPTPGLTSKYFIYEVCVCVCVYTHIHPRTLPPALKIGMTQTTPLSFLLSKITPHAKQQVRLYVSWTPPSSFPNAERNKLHIHARICTSCSESEANAYADVYNICLTYTPAYAWCSTTPVNACILSAKMHMNSCMRACAMVQKLLGHKSYCEFILSLAARASCRLSFAARPPASSTKSVSRHCSLKQSVQIHASSWRGRRCGVA